MPPPFQSFARPPPEPLAASDEVNSSAQMIDNMPSITPKFFWLTGWDESLLIFSSSPATFDCTLTGAWRLHLRGAQQAITSIPFPPAPQTPRPFSHSSPHLPHPFPVPLSLSLHFFSAVSGGIRASTSLRPRRSHGKGARRHAPRRKRHAPAWIRGPSAGFPRLRGASPDGKRCSPGLPT